MVVSEPEVVTEGGKSMQEQLTDLIKLKLLSDMQNNNMGGMGGMGGFGGIGGLGGIGGMGGLGGMSMPLRRQVPSPITHVHTLFPPPTSPPSPPPGLYTHSTVQLLGRV